MPAHINIHYANKISARAGGTSGAPLIINAAKDDHTLTDEIALFTDDFALSRRLANAINDAVKPAELITTTRQAGVMAGLVDALWDEDCSLDEAKTLLRAALGEYENRLEDAYQRQQDSLTESGGPDDSAHRKQIVDAGRGHLLR
jgi:hypothetical protein